MAAYIYEAQLVTVVTTCRRYYQDVCLLEQPYVMDDSQRVQDVIKVCKMQPLRRSYRIQCVSMRV